MGFLSLNLLARLVPLERVAEAGRRLFLRISSFWSSLGLWRKLLRSTVIDDRSVASLDVLPVEVIGVIFFHLKSARHVARAATTCRKWRDAAAHHLRTLTFDISEFPIRQLIRNPDAWQMSITEAIMRTTSLRELSIGATDGIWIRNVLIHGAPLMACLLHTKKTLKSLSLMARVTTQVDVLRKLSGKEGALEHLVWHPTYIPALDPAIHNLPFLVSLTLDRVLQGVNLENLGVLLVIFPKLQSLCLSRMLIKYVPAKFELYLTLSLKTLRMDTIHFESSRSARSTLVLHADNLETLSLSNVESEGFVEFDITRISGLKDLVICNANLTPLELGNNLQHLVLADAHFLYVRSADLASLHHLKLRTTGDLKPMWPKYAYIIANASLNLSSLQLLGGLPAHACLDVEKILPLFPYLRRLALDYPHATFGNPPQNRRVWQHVVDLELHTAVEATDTKLFARWTVELLERCPNLKQVVIALHGGNHDKSEFAHRLTSLLGGLMSPYRNIDVLIEDERHN